MELKVAAHGFSMLSDASTGPLSQRTVPCPGQEVVERVLPDGAVVAVDAGLYDQSHLVNDFRELCGFTPGEFRREVISGASKTAA